MELTLNYGLYNSMVSEGNRVRRMRRTELSYDKICFINSPKMSRPPSRTTYIVSDERVNRTTSMPKLQSLQQQKGKIQNSTIGTQFYRIQNEYYQNKNKELEPSQNLNKPSKISESYGIRAISNCPEKQSSQNILQSSRKSSQVSQKSSRSRKSNISAFKNSKLFSRKSQNVVQQISNAKQTPDGSHFQRQRLLCEVSKQLGPVTDDIYEIKKTTIKQESVFHCSSKLRHKKLKTENSGLSKYNVLKSEGNSKIFKQEEFEMKKENSLSQNNQASKISHSNHDYDHDQSECRYNSKECSKNNSKNNSKMQKFSDGIQNNERDLSSSEYMLKSSMLHSDVEPSISKKVPKSKFSKFKPSNVADPIIHSSNLKVQNWKDTIKSISFDEKNSKISKRSRPSRVSKSSRPSKLSRASKAQAMAKQSSLKDRKSIVTSNHNQARMSLKIESVRANENPYNIEMSKDKGRTSIKNLPLASKELSAHVSEEVEIPCKDNLEDVFERINLYDSMLEMVYDFSQKIKQIYSGDEETETLCFLLEKKYLFEKSNLLKCLKSSGRNVFTLQSVQIPDQILQKYLTHPEIVKFTQDLQKSNISFYRDFSERVKDLRSKFKNDPIFDALTPNDNFVQELITRLGDEIQQIYAGLQSIQEEDLDEAEDLVIEIMELVFFFSDIRGRKVKRMEFPDYIQDFDGYYEKNIVKLEETLKYFSAM